jgi:DNA-binding protein H-NS
MGLQDNFQNMLAQAEGQAQANGIDKLCLLQNEVTPPSNRPYIMQDDLGKHAVWSRQGTDPDGSGMLLTLRDSLEKFSKIIQRRRQYDEYQILYIWTP